MSMRAGQVELEGTLAGPMAQWPLRSEQLKEALLKAGAPEDALQLVVDGGWLTIEPPIQNLRVAAFGGASPAQALSQALEQLRLAFGSGMDEEWASTLRLVEYGENSKIEALVGLTQEGIQTVGRESPWKAVPPASELDVLRKYWKVILVFIFAVGGTLYLNRAELMESWNNAVPPAANDE